ncbi:ribonuclease D, partial [Mycobacterium tuberculosis]
RPPALSDTALAGRLAGFARVPLAALVARFLGLGLPPGPGAAAWSPRPLPSAWLPSAALAVALLLALRAALSRVLAAPGPP